MSLSQIPALLQTAGINADGWLTDAQSRAEKVLLFRNYVEGDHRGSHLTTEMASLLRVNRQQTLTQFNVNHMANIVDTMADRLYVQRLEADNDAATEWASDFLKTNRFDGLQDDLHRATCRDGDTFLIVDFDNKTQRVRWTHDGAYDTLGGVVPIYSAPKKLACVAKLWTVSRDQMADSTRLNLYFPDRIEKYISAAAGGMEKYYDDGENWPLKWTDRNGKPLGIPVIHFRNRGAEYADSGLSEIENAIPLQDALNRILYSSVMTAEYGAFPIRMAIGAKPPTGVTPAMWLSVYAMDSNRAEVAPTAQDIDYFKSVRFESLPAADLSPYISTAHWIEEQMYTVTNTPRTVGDEAASGESQKQREVKLLGKIRSFQTKIGNAWEDALMMAQRVQAAFGEPAPTATRFNAVWRSAEMRDEKQMVENAEKVRPYIPLRDYYRLLAPVYGWDEDRIEQMAQEMGQAEQQRLMGMRALMPNVGIDVTGVRQGA